MNTEKIKENAKPEDLPFNGSIDTLNRIHTLINDIIICRVNQNWIGMRENLAELLNEAQGCLNQAEFLKAWKDWRRIEEYKIIIDEDNNFIFDDDLISELKNFSSWLRLKLYKHNLTMARITTGIDKLGMLYKRYNIN